MANVFDIIVGATCATVRSTHGHRIDRLRLVMASVCVVPTASSLKKFNPRRAAELCRMWRPNLADDRLSEQIWSRTLNSKLFEVPVGLVDLELCCARSGQGFDLDPGAGALE